MGSFRAAMKTSMKVARIAVADAGIRVQQVRRLGVGHTGNLDLEKGTCVSWGGSPEWKNVALRRTLAEAFQMEVTMDDRARAVAVAEYWATPTQERHRNAIYVHIGTGIGSGIFIDGRLMGGDTQGGGEIGHLVIDRQGPLCSCGNRGCVESFASPAAVAARVAQALGRRVEEIRIREVIASADRGNRHAAEALKAAGEALGAGIANAVQLLNPSMVVLCGSVVNLAREYLLDAVVQTVRRQCFETLSRHIEIRLAPYRKDISTVGCALLAARQEAAALVQERLFTAGPQ
jgi:predicted NBD/HSP70 family sugar kinase